MPSESDIIECPAEGCSYKGPKQGVVGHFAGKRDGMHEGKFTEAQDNTSEEDSKQPQDTPTTNSGDNPTFGSADPMDSAQPYTGPSKEQQQSQQQEQDDEPRCIKCGGEPYDFRDYENLKEYEVNGNDLLIQGDYQCSECGYWMIDE